MSSVRSVTAGGVTVTAIVISFNTRATTLRCIEHLMPEIDAGGGECILVDNASNDGSVAAVAAAFPTVRIIANERNVGFGAANNQAMAVARGGFLLLVNSDAFVSPGSVERMVAYLRAHADVGIVGPKLLNADGSLQPSAWPFPSPARCWVEALALSPLVRGSGELRDWRRWAHDASGPVPWLSGACLLVRNEVIADVGGFDDAFFLYGEETDWQKRARAAGWAVHFVADATVTHLGGASGLSEKQRTRALFFDGVDRYVRKHHGRGGLAAARAAIFAGALIRWPAFSLLSRVRPAQPRFRERAEALRWIIARVGRPSRGDAVS